MRPTATFAGRALPSSSFCALVSDTGPVTLSSVPLVESYRTLSAVRSSVQSFVSGSCTMRIHVPPSWRLCHSTNVSTASWSQFASTVTSKPRMPASWRNIASVRRWPLGAPPTLGLPLEMYSWLTHIHPLDGSPEKIGVPLQPSPK